MERFGLCVYTVAETQFPYLLKEELLRPQTNLMLSGFPSFPNWKHLERKFSEAFVICIQLFKNTKLWYFDDISCFLFCLLVLYICIF